MVEIELRAHCPTWAQSFDAERARIATCLGRVAIAVHHVGSTSVPGLSAKPIIDISLTVPDTTREANYIPALESAGYDLWRREPDWFEHRLLKRSQPGVNLHVFSRGCEEIERMLAFRDHLRSNADDRRLYEQTKRALARSSWPTVQAYADAKTEVIAAILARAYSGAYLP